MKKILVAMSLAFAASGASAAGLSLAVSQSNVVLTHQAGDGSDQLWGGDGSTLDAGLYTSGTAGTLNATQAGWFEATYLGKVAGYSNAYLNMGGGTVMGDSTVGSTAGMVVAAGQKINFGFGDNTGNGGSGTFVNGQANNPVIGMLFFDAAAWNAKHNTTFDFLIGYNDSGNSLNADFDDYVVGVVNHVPVPAALPLMASALGAFGISRRKSKTVA